MEQAAATIETAVKLNHQAGYPRQGAWFIAHLGWAGAPACFGDAEPSQSRNPDTGARLLVASSSLTVAERVADMAEMTSDANVVTLDRRGSAGIPDHGSSLLDVVFGWADLVKLRRLVTTHCTAAGLTGSRLDDFVLAVHEISANAAIHAGAAGRLILQRAAHGIRCLIADTAPETALSCPAPRSAEMRELCEPNDPAEPAGADSGRGLWLAAALADELSITSGPDGAIVSLHMRLG